MGALMNSLGFNIINVGNFKPFGDKTFWTLVHGAQKGGACEVDFAKIFNTDFLY